MINAYRPGTKKEYRILRNEMYQVLARWLQADVFRAMNHTGPETLESSAQTFFSLSFKKNEVKDSNGVFRHGEVCWEC